MGEVWEAHQLGLDRSVALKLIRTDAMIGASAQEMEDRFIREATSLAKIQHKNVVTIYDFGRGEQGQLFIAMELVDGKQLSVVLAEEGPLEMTRVVDIAIQIARGLREAHTAGVVHRDLKLSNIIVSKDSDGLDRVKLLDFGLAKPTTRRATDVDLTSGHQLVGSPRFVSPEQAAGDAVDARSDIYSFGVLLYALISGTVPFDGTVPEIVRGHLAGTPPRLDATGYLRPCPDGLQKLVDKCLQKLPDNRPESATAVILSLKAIALELAAPRKARLLSDSGWTTLEPTKPVQPATDLPPPARRKLPIHWLVVPALMLFLGLWGVTRASRSPETPVGQTWKSKLKPTSVKALEAVPVSSATPTTRFELQTPAKEPRPPATEPGPASRRVRVTPERAPNAASSASVEPAPVPPPPNLDIQTSR